MLFRLMHHLLYLAFYKGWGGQDVEAILRNCCKNVIRTRWFRMRHVNMEADTESNHNDPIENIVEKNSICAAIMALNASDRQIIVLYYYQELSVKEIAMIIGKSENTTIQRLNRARGKMKKILTEAGYDRERH